MSLIVDRQFIGLLSTKLERFVQKNDYIWNFRCPICGDSKKNKFKSRGYVYRKKSDLFFSCHNCGTSLSMGNLIKTIDPSLYREYQMEKFKETSHSNAKAPDFSEFKSKPVFNIKTKINLPTIVELPADHDARKYLASRKVPEPALEKLYYAANFKSFVEEIKPDYDKDLIAGEKRIIIPFYDEKNILLGFQGRSIGESKIKYITVKLHDDNRKIFGLDVVDFTKKIYVVEGPLDSLYLVNGIATMDAALYSVIAMLGDHDYVFVFDNEPRNPDIVRRMKRTIDMQKNICIWPKNIVEKDINDMVCAGMTGGDIQGIIDRNTHNGLKAKLEFELWKKV